MSDSAAFQTGSVVALKVPMGDASTVALIERVGTDWLVVPYVDSSEGDATKGSGPAFSLSPDALGAEVSRLTDSELAAVYKEQALLWSRRFARHKHGGSPNWADQPEKQFDGEQGTVPYAGRVYGEDEVAQAVDASLDFWLTLGKEGDAFEKGLAKRLGVKRSLLVNSGSSANLLAISALTSHKLPRERRLMPGDEVITCAAGFPTTVAPILQNGLCPVFIDNDPVTLSPCVEQLESAFTEGRTKAVIFAHAMGNPFDLASVVHFCRKHDLWLIEDNCDALGSYYENTLADGTTLSGETGTFGDLSTQSFYPPHHLTMGEGGAVNIVRDMKLKLLVESFRDWGRDCWCPSGKDNTCRKRFGWQLGDLPEGYDHKYIYSHLGYNLKPLDVQAAIGRVQLGRLDAFIAQRKANWHYLRRGLDPLSDFLGFCLPIHASGWTVDEGYQWSSDTGRSDPSWFGFMMRVLPDAGFTRAEFSRFLDEKRIGNRALFGGNLLRQPAFVELKRQCPESFRVVGSLEGADALMHQAVFIGVYPGMNRAMLDYMIDMIHTFCTSHS